MTSRGKASEAPASYEMTPDMVVVGKDVLELLSSAMYVDPMAIYREYIQNAADAIDEARAHGLIHERAPGDIQIIIDPCGRDVRIRDNGIGLTTSTAPRRLLSVGASYKRGANLRGFRGVGRLAGLGYCRELVFRAKAAGDHDETEVVWDCRSLRANLRDPAFTGDIVDLVRGVVRLRRNQVADTQAHYFEVEMRGVVRHKNDALLDVAGIKGYLAQVAPVPFSPDFSFGAEVTTTLAPRLRIGSLHIHVNGSAEPIYRPHRDVVPVSDTADDRFTELEFFELFGVDGDIAAVGWLLHHGYLGAIPVKALIRGLRARCGDIQVGGSGLFEDCFQEDRFNGWIVGEIHVVDQRIVPNGRRDHFEQNMHFSGIHNQLMPICRRLVRTCRETSVIRNRLREFHRSEQVVVDFMNSLFHSPDHLAAAHHALNEMRRISGSKVVSEEEQKRMRQRVGELSAGLAALPKNRSASTATEFTISAKDALEDITAAVTSTVDDDELANTLVARILAAFNARQLRCPIAQ